MDGCEFLRCLRRESNVPAIMLGRWDDEAIKLAALESGADDYLTQPCNPSELLARMDAHRAAAEQSDIRSARHAAGHDQCCQQSGPSL